jgi:hypothetical protein
LDWIHSYSVSAAYCAAMSGVAGAADSGRVADRISSKVCWHGLGAIALDSVQHVVKERAEVGSMLAKRGRPCRPPRPRYRHDASVAVGAASKVLASH